jgi:branched-chain amino acid transport system ATP-binding protein
MADVMTAPAGAKASTGAQMEIRGLEAWYGESHVLHGVDIDIREGEVVTLLGRNGAGKTSTLRSIMGLVPRRTGSVKYDGKEFVNARPDVIARAGIAYCPEERGIFASLDVTENLMLPPTVRPGGLPLDEIYTLFPNLKERARSQGTKLSGGEQQMLAIARALMLRPRLLLLDEPSFGLAPLIVKEIFGIMRTINQTEKVTILLVEQNAAMALDLAHQAYLIETGRLAMSGPAEKLKQDEAVRRAYLGY